MGLFLTVVAAPVAGPLKGLLWLARTIQEQADRVLYDEDGLRAALLALEERFEAGELDEAAFEAEEAVLLERLKISRSRTREQGQ